MALSSPTHTSPDTPEAGLRPRLRFAPSPNGFLHLGHAYSAFETWRIADALGGDVLLRIEDIDVARSRETFVDAIVEDLGWLGLAWSGPVRRQSAHFEMYDRAAQQLREAGLLYPSAMSRRDIAHAVARHATWPRDPDGAPRFERSLEASAPEDNSTSTAWRLDMARCLAIAGDRLSWREFIPPEGRLPREQESTRHARRMKTIARAAQPEVWGDVMLQRKDIPTTYHLSVVVDDAAQGITHVVRGQDLEAATDIHALLQHQLGLPQPLYHHHALITDVSGRKLAKRFADTSLRSLREAGWSVADVRAAVGQGPASN
ncbi:MAG: tRNA glutamyl-Q(34) synthetase GluQRS [Pseudomonadota bacterium]